MGERNRRIDAIVRDQKMLVGAGDIDGCTEALRAAWPGHVSDARAQNSYRRVRKAISRVFWDGMNAQARRDAGGS